MNYNPKLYWETRLSKEFDLNGVGFDSFGSSFNQWMYKMSKRNLESLISEGIIKTKGKKVLDIGCGTGFYVDIWLKNGISELAGVDITESSIRNMRNKYAWYRYPKCRFYQCDISSDRFGIQSEKFDIITAFAVLFHIVDDEKFRQAISNISKLCNENGIVLITDIFPHKREYVLNHQKSRLLKDYIDVLYKNNLAVINRIPVHYMLNAPLDVSNGLLQTLALKVWWKYIVGGLELTTHMVGFLFYYIDLLLTKWFSESPSTEMLICKKI